MCMTLTKRFYRICSATFFTSCFFTVTAFAQYAAPGQAAPAGHSFEGNMARLSVAGSIWRSSGDHAFKMEDRLGVFSDVGYPLDGTMAEIRVGYQYATPVIYPGMASGLGVKVGYAESLEMSGTSTDTDYDLRGFAVHYSESDNETDARIWNVDGVISLSPLPVAGSAVPAERSAVQINLLFGYGEHRYNHDTQNLRYSYDYGADEGSLEGPVSSYDVTFQSLRMGAELVMQMDASFFVSGSFVFLPYVRAESDALWLLRDYPFQQEAEGYGAAIDIKAGIALADAVWLYGGMRYVSLVADTNGKESGVSNGQTYYDAPIVGEITAEYAGFEGGLIISF